MAELVRNVLYAGLAGALMAAALAGFCFFLCLLIRLVRWLRKSPEERQNLRARKRAAKGHAFARVPGRERTAYLISCLEAALTVYSQAPGDWQWVLERLRPLADAGVELEPFCGWPFFFRRMCCLFRGRKPGSWTPFMRI